KQTHECLSGWTADFRNGHPLLFLGLPAFAADGELHSRSKSKRQRWESVRCVVMLVQQVLSCGKNLHRRMDRVAGMQIQLLIGVCKVAVRQKQRRTKETVREKGAVVPATGEVSGQARE